MLTSCHHTPKDRILPFERIENGRELGDRDVAMLKDRFQLSDVYDFRFDAEEQAALQSKFLE